MIRALRATLELGRFTGKVTDSPHSGQDAKLKADAMPRAQAHVDFTFFTFLMLFCSKGERPLLSNGTTV